MKTVRPMKLVLLALVFFTFAALLQFAAPTHVLAVPDVRAIYLIPSDRTFNPGYQAAIASALVELQDWYSDQLGGTTFTLHMPIVESLTTPHPASYYATNPTGGPSAAWFFFNVVAEGIALTGGQYNDPAHRWLYYIDAEPALGQIGGAAAAGVAELPGQDLRGLTGQEPEPVSRWIGGLGHELGHTFGLPHPPGCEPTPSTPDCPMDALMWLGFYEYPNTYLLPADKEILLSSPFFTATSVPEPGSLLLLSSGLAALVATKWKGSARIKQARPTTISFIIGV